MSKYVRYQNQENDKIMLEFLKNKPLGATLNEIRKELLDQGFRTSLIHLNQRIAFLKSKNILQHVGPSTYRILPIKKEGKKRGPKPKEYFNPKEPNFIY